MVLPRFLLVSLRPSAAEPGEVPEPRGPSYGWRLLGPNNRELGRSAVRLDSLALLDADIRGLQGGLGASHVVAARGASLSGWTWALERDGELAARSARAYHRERECRYSAEQFVAAVPAGVWALPDDAGALPSVPSRAFRAQSLVFHPPARALP